MFSFVVRWDGAWSSSAGTGCGPTIGVDNGLRQMLPTPLPCIDRPYGQCLLSYRLATFPAAICNGSLMSIAGVALSTLVDPLSAQLRRPSRRRPLLLVASLQCYKGERRPQTRLPLRAPSARCAPPGPQAEDCAFSNSRVLNREPLSDAPAPKAGRLMRTGGQKMQQFLDNSRMLFL